MPAKLRLVSLEPIIRSKRPQICQRCQDHLHRARQQSRTLSTTIPLHEEESATEAPGRWSYTPERLKAPVSMYYAKQYAKQFAKPRQIWNVNESQEKVDEFYITLLGEGGDKILTDEVKWLALTHKTFEQGKRGYNDRLAFLGQRIMDLQSSLALLNRTDGTFAYPPDPYQRKPFKHPGIDLLPRLTIESRKYVTNPARLAGFAMRKGIEGVMRWKPLDVTNLKLSGVDTVLSGGIYAIIGGIALQRGGEMATRAVQERILPEIGLSPSREEELEEMEEMPETYEEAMAEPRYSNLGQNKNADPQTRV